MPPHKSNKPVVFTIYALRDLDGAVRYVGITVKLLSVRLREHIWAAKRGERTHKGAWIRSMLPNHPTIVEIERTLDQMRERHWIEFYRVFGCKLTNLTNGGDTHIGHNFTPEHRAKLSAALKGQKKSEEHKEKLRKFHTGRGHSEETKKKISRIGKGRKHRQETRDKISASHRGIGHTAETRAKLSEIRKKIAAARREQRFRQNSHVQGELWEE